MSASFKDGPRSAQSEACNGIASQAACSLGIPGYGRAIHEGNDPMQKDMLIGCEFPCDLRARKFPRHSNFDRAQAAEAL
jgi:hypothetical protein